MPLRGRDAPKSGAPLAHAVRGQRHSNMEESLQKLIGEISTLKWLLGFVTLLLLIVTSMLVFAFKMMIKAVKTEFRAEARVFEEQAENLLDEGKDTELRRLAEKRLNEAGSDAWAHYYLGMALYRLRDPFLSKQHFEKAGELNPRLKSIADECLEEVNLMLKENKPRLV